jgi:hypothetical protein
MDRIQKILLLAEGASELCDSYRKIDQKHDTEWRNVQYEIDQIILKLDELHYTKIPSSRKGFSPEYLQSVEDRMPYPLEPDGRS